MRKPNSYERIRRKACLAHLGIMKMPDKSKQCRHSVLWGMATLFLI
jgi:hypothetical protein